MSTQSFIGVEHVVHAEGSQQSAIVAIGFGLASGIEVWRYRDCDAEWFEVGEGLRLLPGSYPDHRSAMYGALSVLHKRGSLYA